MENLENYYQKALTFKQIHPVDLQTANYIVEFIKANEVKTMLEIGSGVGYSANYFALNSEIKHIDSYERVFEFYEFATQNKLSDKINFIYKDFLYGEVKIETQYPLIFIDAAKTKQIEFFEKASQFLTENGTIIVDNLNLNRLKTRYFSPAIGTKTIKSIENIFIKTEAFKAYLKNQTKFKVFHIDVGDGIAVCCKTN